jgi:hypothetical protein
MSRFHISKHGGGYQGGWYAPVNALFGDLKALQVDRSVIPRTTLTIPEVAIGIRNMLGLNIFGTIHYLS